MLQHRSPNTPPRLAHRAGFTLVELIAAVAIIAITLSFAVPAGRNMVINQRLKSAASDLHFSLIFARSEAIKRHAVVTVSAASGGWENGWTITDDNGNTLRSHEGFEGVADNDAAAFAATRADQLAPTSVAFSGSGRLSGSANEVQFFPASSVVTTPAMRCVAVSLSGHPRTEVDADHDSSNGCNG
ncbi:GspH/FimT family pseudopilin [Endothiovibrio diazotrophicus]